MWYTTKDKPDGDFQAGKTVFEVHMGAAFDHAKKLGITVFGRPLPFPVLANGQGNELYRRSSSTQAEVAHEHTRTGRG
jgi:hypothetical protein